MPRGGCLSGEIVRACQRNADSLRIVCHFAGPAADEILRRAHPVHHFRRTAARDVTVHGRRIKAGDKVTMWYASGNFDEEKFPDP